MSYLKVNSEAYEYVMGNMVDSNYVFYPSNSGTN